ncbi:MAG: UDP-N-acetylglucosamine--N-acetylmuramyl-(pentapeptide) pyrophosphoryl-undecaprenol N-acetylglucosamine transferase, partial [Muribaculaceae bacterium]|nr:UDP-N-acetylglucosamine--N-acetylmuramyl-(pentapeptide) pyrophosphoryl-undecaprenol N-acetylglucosamine transferase [Muribaculaceae bacterium]
VVARAGAGTISELELLGKASVLVPSPNVAEDHQRHNAEALADRDAAVMIPDAEAAEKLWPEIERLAADAHLRKSLEDNILKMALADSDERIADHIDEIISRKS